MQRVANTFPLLEQYEPKDRLEVDSALVQSRIAWLKRASQAAQDEFALKLMHEEPQGEAFDSTLATVLTMDKEFRDEWLALETTVATKKIEANMAHIKLLYKRYSIAQSKRNRSDDSFEFKFPHQADWVTVDFDHKHSKLLAESAFPLVKATMGRYSAAVRTREAAQVIEEELNGGSNNPHFKSKTLRPSASSKSLKVSTK